MQTSSFADLIQCSERIAIGSSLRVFWCALALIVVSLTSACRKSDDAATPSTNEIHESAGSIQTEVSAETVREIGASKGWEAAEKAAEQALLISPDDVSLLVAVAEVKQRLGKGDEVAALLQAACEADQFEDEALVLQTVAGFMATGQLFESIELLEKVVRAYPERKEMRRWLFDCLVSSEQIHRAIPHGRKLIRDRYFDAVLLFSMSQNEQRDREVQSLNLLAERNPSDVRLKIGMARIEMDHGHFDKASELLDPILSQHPSFLPAWALEGERLLLVDDLDGLNAWERNLPDDVRKHSWLVWAVLGDWAVLRSDYAEAVQCYWRSIEINNGVGKVHAKLAQALKNAIEEKDGGTDSLLTELTQRAELLERLVQEKDRFYRANMKSLPIATLIAKTLSELGRHWEAEAWIANGIRDQPGLHPDATAVRGEIVRHLRSDLPWQTSVPAYETLRQQIVPRLVASSAKSDDLANQISAHSVGSLGQSRRERSNPPKETLTDYRLLEASENFGIDDTRHEPIRLENGMIPIYSQLGSGGAALDYDLDGWPDLFVAGTVAEVKSQELCNGNFYRNVAGHFEGQRDRIGVSPRGYAQGVCTGDLNADGFVDLVQLKYGRDTVFLNNGDGTFSKSDRWFQSIDDGWSTSGAVADLDGDGIADFISLRYCNEKTALTKRCRNPDGSLGLCAPTQYEAVTDHFYQGLPTGGFKSVTDEWCIPPSNPGRGLGIVVGQFDDNSSLDVFVANDMTSNHYWTRSRSESSMWRESGTLSGLALDWRSRPQASMGIATGDLDGDLDVDFYVTNFEKEHNALYLQQSPGIWADRASSAGLVTPSFDLLGFGAVAIDLDNGGSQEVFVTNGHVEHDAEVGYEQPPLLWSRNRGEFSIVPNEEIGGYFLEKHVGRAVWSMDVDRDRRADLLITHQGAPTAILHNQTDEALANQSLQLRLVGTRSGRDAVGTVVTVIDGERKLRHWVTAGDGFLASSDRLINVGLGQRDGNQAVAVEIQWPTGVAEQFRVVPNHETLLVEGTSETYVIDR